jgi:hypothetical protein
MSDNCFQCGRDISAMSEFTGDEILIDDEGHEFCSEGCLMTHTTPIEDTSGISDGTFSKSGETFMLEKGETL